MCERTLSRPESRTEISNSSSDRGLWFHRNFPRSGMHSDFKCSGEQWNQMHSSSNPSMCQKTRLVSLRTSGVQPKRLQDPSIAHMVCFLKDSRVGSPIRKHPSDFTKCERSSRYPPAKATDLALQPSQFLNVGERVDNSSSKYDKASFSIFGPQKFLTYAIIVASSPFQISLQSLLRNVPRRNDA